MIVYLESSAGAKLVLEEAETDALKSFLDGLTPQDSAVSSILLETELRRLAVRKHVDQSVVTRALDSVRLTVMPRGIFTEAGTLPGDHLRSLDALHLASAMRLDTDLLISYDNRLLAAADALGLRIASPA